MKFMQGCMLKLKRASDMVNVLVRSILLGVLIIFGHCAFAQPPANSGYKLLFEENFQGNSLDTTKWHYRIERRTMGTWIDAVNLKENVSVKNGELHIALKHERINGKYENTGGGIISNHDFGYGYYECLSKPFMEGRGTHTSFWQRGSLSPNNNVFEIDGYEIDSKTLMASNNLYLDIVPKWMKANAHPWPHRSAMPITLDSNGYYLDAWEYTPEGVNFFDNGKLVASAEWNELNTAQMVWLTALNGTGKVDTTKLPGESTFKYFKFYAKDYPGINLLPNGNFEYNQNKFDKTKPISWSVKGTKSSVIVQEGDACRDDYRLRFGGNNVAFKNTISQTLNYILNGNYQLTAMVRASGKIGKAALRASGFGEKELRTNINLTDKWTLVSLGDIPVSNNTISVEVEAEGNQGDWIDIDDIQLMKPAFPNQKRVKAQRVFDNQRPFWQLALNKPIVFIGDQKFYLFDRNVGCSDSITVSFTMKAAVLSNTTLMKKMPKEGNAGWAILLKDDGNISFCVGSASNNTEVIAPKAYQPQKEANITCEFEGGTASIFSNGKLLKRISGITQNTKEAETPGKLGAIYGFDAIADVIRSSSQEDEKKEKPKNYLGTIQNLKIYNRIIQ